MSLLTTIAKDASILRATPTGRLNVAIVPIPFAEPLAVPPLPPARVVTVPIACAEAWGSSTINTASSRARSDNRILGRFARAVGLGQRRCNATDRAVVDTELACSRSMQKIDDVNKDAITVSRQKYINAIISLTVYFIIEHRDNVYGMIV